MSGPRVCGFSLPRLRDGIKSIDHTFFSSPCQTPRSNAPFVWAPLEILSIASLSSSCDIEKMLEEGPPSPFLVHCTQRCFRAAPSLPPCRSMDFKRHFALSFRAYRTRWGRILFSLPSRKGQIRAAPSPKGTLARVRAGITVNKPGYYLHRHEQSRLDDDSFFRRLARRVVFFFLRVRRATLRAAFHQWREDLTLFFSCLIEHHALPRRSCSRPVLCVCTHLALLAFTSGICRTLRLRAPHQPDAPAFFFPGSRSSFFPPPSCVCGAGHSNRFLHRRCRSSSQSACS